MTKAKSPSTSQLAGTDTLDRSNTNDKLEALEKFRSDATEQALRTNQGVKISDNQNTLKVGSRGPSLLEDFIMREKITHFDHERIPERIVHARGSAAHGVFQVRKKTNPGSLAPAGVGLIGRALRPSDEWVEEHSVGERGLVHLGHGGEEVVSAFHDGCHYPADVKALQGVVALARGSLLEPPCPHAPSLARSR